jgi:hypothetical protein
MQNHILGDVAFAAQYARPTSEGGRENWTDAVNRVEKMHLHKVPTGGS